MHITPSFVRPFIPVNLRGSSFRNAPLLSTRRCPTYRTATPMRRRAVQCSESDATVSPTPLTSSSSSPPSPSESSTPAPPPPKSQSSLRDRFDHLRGADVEPVSAAMMRFTTSFTRPVPIVYRAVVNETITTTHLARVCAMWRYDAVFAFGFDSIFSAFLRYYPNAEERDELYTCMAGALKFESSVLKDAAASVSTWVDGKTEEDVFSALDAAAPGASTDSVGPVIEALVYIRDSGDNDWYYSRLFGLGLIQIMSVVGTELSIANAEKWADKIGLEKSKLTAEMGSYLSGMERLKQAEQIFAEATAREAKKTAERLAEKAKKAAEEADLLEKDPAESSEGKAETTSETTNTS